MIPHADLFSLKDRTALVTGATGHLGQQIAAVLAAHGAHVLVNSRDANRANTVVDALVAAGGSAEPMVFDVTREAEVARQMEPRSSKPLHVLVNCAYGGGSGTVATSTPEDFAGSYQSSVIAAQMLFKAALPGLRLAAERQGDASVINVASMYAMVSPRLSNYADAQSANPPFYGAAKAALLQWTRYAACEFAGSRIRVNAISPGPFPSPEAQAKNPDLMAKLKLSSPAGRLGDAREIRSSVMFLASPASSYVSGTNVVVDGGWTSW